MNTKLITLALVAGSLAAPALAQCNPTPNRFCVTTGTKTASNPNPGGFPLAFYINGVEAPVVTLTRGQTYQFRMVNTSAAHPFYISRNREGASTETYADGVTPSNGVSGNATLTWVVAANAPDLLYYQCRTHTRMGWQVRIINPPCPSDFNGDGFVDFFDFDDFVSCFDGTTCPAGQDADFNNDGFADFFDFDDFVTAFETGC